MSQTSRYEIRESVTPSTPDTRSMGVAGRPRFQVWDTELDKPVPFSVYRDRESAQARIRRREERDRERGT